MAKIVYMSDSPNISTGYGRVSKELTTAFHNAGHEVIVIGWGYQGEPHNFPFKIVPCNTHTERFGEDILAQLIRTEKPDFLFTLGDPWMTEYVPNLEERSAVTWCSYFPIDGMPVPPNWHSWMKNIDIPVVFSKYSQKLCTDILGFEPPLIYHGVDSEMFKPVEDKKALKRKILGRDDQFIVGVVARNQPRKNLPALVRGFAEFAKGKDNVALYLHCQAVDVGWNMNELVETYGVGDITYNTGNFNALKGVSDQQLANIYNLFDVFSLPTMSEGFGLPIVEAQSCEVPVLVTDFSACTELVQDRQELIKVKDTIVMGRNINQAIADTDDLARKLNIFYNDWKRGGQKIEELGKKGRKFAQSIDWKIINQEFVDLIAKHEERVKSREKVIVPRFYKI